MLFRLVVEKHGKRSKVVELRADSAHIGRAHGNEVRIPSAEVSRSHCLFQVKNGLLKAEDLDSVNGTYLNGDLITGEVVVRPGDRLEVGPVTFVVEYQPTPEAVERLGAMDYEVVAEDSAEVVVAAEEDEDEPVEDGEEVMDVKEGSVMDVEEVVEAEDDAPRIDLEGISWAPSGDGDLRNLLSHLDEGQESLMPRKRPGPRPRSPESDDWQDHHRSGLDPLTKPEDKGGKRRPKPKDE